MAGSDKRLKCCFNVEIQTEDIHIRVASIREISNSIHCTIFFLKKIF